MLSLSRPQQHHSYEHIYCAKQLVEMVGDCVIPIGGLLVNVADLARLGWWCKVVDSHYGSRIKVTFYGPDGKSTISFRAAKGFSGLSLKALCYALTNGVITVLPQMVRNITPDLELLNFVEANIRRRIRKLNKARKHGTFRKAIDVA